MVTSSPLRARWKRGPAATTSGPVLISLTDFHIANARDLPPAYAAAHRLRHAWPELAGAVGMWLWGRPLAKRSGAVSVWTDEEALHDFVTWPVHVAVMRRFRNAGTLVSSTWRAERFDRADVWREAADRLDERALP